MYLRIDGEMYNVNIDVYSFDDQILFSKVNSHDSEHTNAVVLEDENLDIFIEYSIEKNKIEREMLTSIMRNIMKGKEITCL